MGSFGESVSVNRFLANATTLLGPTDTMARVR